MGLIWLKRLTKHELVKLTRYLKVKMIERRIFYNSDCFQKDKRLVRDKVSSSKAILAKQGVNCILATIEITKKQGVATSDQM